MSNKTGASLRRLGTVGHGEEQHPRDVPERGQAEPLFRLVHDPAKAGPRGGRARLPLRGRGRRSRPWSEKESSSNGRASTATFTARPGRRSREPLSQGIDVILDIDVKGALAVKEKWPEAVLIFIDTPSRRRAGEEAYRPRGEGDREADAAGQGGGLQRRASLLMSW